MEVHSIELYIKSIIVCILIKYGNSNVYRGINTPTFNFRHIHVISNFSFFLLFLIKAHL